MRFQSVVRLAGKTATGIPVPDEVVDGLGSGRRPAVCVTINSFTYRTTVATVEGEFMLPLSAENRTGAGATAGDRVEVEIEVDTQPREVNVPPDFAEALDREPEAKRFFDSLSYSHKQRHVYVIEQAKSAETRQRRIEKAIAMLREGRAQ